MKIAIPTAQGRLAMHFGHCEVFRIFDIDDDTKEVTAVRDLIPPAHEPGVLPRWLAEQGAHCIIAGGMGSRAQSLFVQNNIQVVTGAPAEEPEKIIDDFLRNALETGENACSH